jgi:hypothetical protein
MDALSRGIEQLRELEAGTAIASDARGSAFRREGDYWTVVYEGSLVRLRDSKGLRYLSTLLANPGHEFHVIDLEAQERGAIPAQSGLGRRPDSRELEARPDLGDAGEMLDARIRSPNARSGPGVLTADHAASTSRCLASEEPCLEILP